jgi:hypothetical protein
MSFDPKGYALSAEDGTAVWFLDTRMTVKAGGDETNGQPPWGSDRRRTGTTARTRRST